MTVGKINLSKKPILFATFWGFETHYYLWCIIMIDYLLKKQTKMITLNDETHMFCLLKSFLNAIVINNINLAYVYEGNG